MSARALDSRAAAAALDRADPLYAFRGEFALPRRERHEEPSAYLCGHSLGLAPRTARRLVEEELDRWERLGVDGHFAGRRPWVDYADAPREPLAKLVGGAAEDVLVANSLTTNLQLLLASFYEPRGERRRVLLEAGAFSSDRHAVETMLQLRGLDPHAQLLELAPEPGADLLEIEAIESAIARAGDRLALVLWPGVQYRTGQAFDCARIARAAHAVGAIAGFDHAHAIGNLPLDVERDGADFAVWCSYKYLNGGPGAIGGLYVHPRHAGRARLAGWWGHEPRSRFDMEPGFVAARGAAGWAVSNPPIFSTAPLLASLELFERAGIAALRQRSIALTAALEATLAARVGARIAIVTPSSVHERGCQLSLRLVDAGKSARELQHALVARGLHCDFRAPDLLRVAPAPLYNGYEDIWRFVDGLAAVLGEA